MVKMLVDSQMSAPSRLSLLGLPIDRVDMAQALDLLSAAIDTASRSHGQAQQVVTLNPEMVMAARHDVALREAILSADLVVPDGVGLLWAARFAGTALPERVTGVDLLERFAARAAIRRYRIFLLGAAPGVAERAQQRLLQRYPDLIICGTYAGSPAPEEEDALCARIRNAQTDALFVAFGVPAQECWLSRNRNQVGAAVAVGVGGAFDFLAGATPRAPKMLRHIGMEWAYRLWREPWRWRRMLALPHFAILAAYMGLSQRCGWKIGVDASRGHH